MEMRNHRLGIVSAVLCFLSCLTRTPAADVIWFQDEGLRAVGSSHYKELHAFRDRHSMINHLDNVPRNSAQLQDDEPWRSMSSPDSEPKAALFQSIQHRYHSHMPKWLASTGSKRLRRSMVHMTPNPAPAPSPNSAPAPSSGAPAPGPTQHAHRRHPSKATRWGVGFSLGTVAGAIIGILSGVVLHYILTYRRKRSRTLSYKNPVIFNKHITTNMLEFLHKDDALEGANLVGEGGSGKVYRVPLSNDIVVAVKSVTRINPRQADQETPAPTDSTVPAPTPDAKAILAELDTLGYIRHRNLIQLWAYIYKGDSHLLIYEYMPRGSLRDAFRQMTSGELTLTWPQRHRIMCGVAQGLAYLHNSHGTCIVHRDLKPGNILLTDDLEAKLGDFGLAAILPDTATHGSTEHLAGTIGYIAPEFHQTLRYSQKADIYSFGVVLAQMVTGREPTEDAFIEDGGSMGMWLQRCLNSEEEKMEAIDAELRGEREHLEEIELAMKVAVFCTNVDPQLRPSSTDVLSMLMQLRTSDLPAHSGPLTGPS
ncbi:hypothetical protein KC19_3G182100 [Ceratodon purpureus]|uniref:Protein kinase domain-containing protein n=1 Tax=Ceratodon purpureus TaxID=3225 RepID=A0A8T0IM13_CERPU|nr:hypothetical protein KC19_3G182100 [Ceratodon purpureus]